LQTPEKSVRALLHDEKGTYAHGTLAIFAFLYFLLGTWTYGLSVPSGLFIPCLLCGAAWGRMIGMWMGEHFQIWFPQIMLDPGKFALGNYAIGTLSVKIAHGHEEW
jgi:chloride channel 7